jgi:hypothetical protein
MTEFLQTALTFPTLLYSILLAFCAIYWLLASTGLVDIDALDGFLGGDGDSHHASDSAGLLARMGLGGVPIMIVLTVLSFFGWTVTYFVHLMVLQHLPAPLRMLGGIATLVGALVPGVFITSLLLRPVRKLIVKLRPPVRAPHPGPRRHGDFTRGRWQARARRIRRRRRRADPASARRARRAASSAATAWSCWNTTPPPTRISSFPNRSSTRTKHHRAHHRSFP